jgi:pyridoxal biosynthesis lyase PdxS
VFEEKFGGEAMVGINVDDVPEPHRLAERGW